MFKKIAFIGTGVMGAPMAKNIAKSGFNVHVYNRTFSKAKKLEPDVQAHKDIETCVRDADLIISILGYPQDVKEVYEKIIPQLKDGSILVDMTTSSPKQAKDFKKYEKSHNIQILDAPVTGGDLGAIKGELSIMVGGNKESFFKIKPILQTMGSNINYCGLHGQGQTAKLANQISIATSLVGTAESIAFAKNQALDPKIVLDIITTGSANSWQAQNNGYKMLAKDFKPGFFLKHLLKDLNLILEEKQDLSLPITEKVTEMYETLAQQGLENAGSQALIEYYK